MKGMRKISSKVGNVSHNSSVKPRFEPVVRSDTGDGLSRKMDQRNSVHHRMGNTPVPTVQRSDISFNMLNQNNYPDNDLNNAEIMERLVDNLLDLLMGSSDNSHDILVEYFNPWTVNDFESIMDALIASYKSQEGGPADELDEKILNMYKTNLLSMYKYALFDVLLADVKNKLNNDYYGDNSTNIRSIINGELFGLVESLVKSEKSPYAFANDIDDPILSPIFEAYTGHEVSTDVSPGSSDGGDTYVTVGSDTVKVSSRIVRQKFSRSELPVVGLEMAHAPETSKVHPISALELSGTNTKMSSEYEDFVDLLLSPNSLKSDVAEVGTPSVVEAEEVILDEAIPDDLDLEGVDDLLREVERSYSHAPGYLGESRSSARRRSKT